MVGGEVLEGTALGTCLGRVSCLGSNRYQLLLKTGATITIFAFANANIRMFFTYYSHSRVRILKKRSHSRLLEINIQLFFHLFFSVVFSQEWVLVPHPGNVINIKMKMIFAFANIKNNYSVHHYSAKHKSLETVFKNLVARIIVTAISHSIHYSHYHFNEFLHSHRFICLFNSSN